MILVTGASGHLGQLAIDSLLTSVPATSLAALVRDPAKNTNLKEQGVELRTGDYFDYPSLEKAFAGVDTLLMVSSGSLENRVEQHTNAIKAAQATGVKHIVYTSMVGAKPDMKFVTGSDHYYTEEALKESGIPYTVLRNGLYSEALADQLMPALGSGQWYYPGEGATVNSVARTDLAEALATVGLDPSAHQNQTYTLTGNRVYTFPEIAALLSEVAGQPVSYVPISLDDYRSALAGFGVPEPFIPIAVSVPEAQQAGEMSAVDGALATVLGRKPEDLGATLKKLLPASV